MTISVYTRKDIARDLGCSYKKAINAFSQLVDAGLIIEKRGSNSAPKLIYIVKPEAEQGNTEAYIKEETVGKGVKHEVHSAGETNCPRSTKRNMRSTKKTNSPRNANEPNAQISFPDIF